MQDRVPAELTLEAPRGLVRTLEHARRLRRSIRHVVCMKMFGRFAWQGVFRAQVLSCQYAFANMPTDVVGR